MSTMTSIDALDAIETALLRDGKAWAHISYNREQCDEDGPAYLVIRGDDALDEDDEESFVVGVTRIWIEDVAACNIIGSILAEAALEFAP